ncbi:MAG: hypothetical protein ACQESP_03790 [Candidatus Muiribacteriota bacterium]
MQDEFNIEKISKEKFKIIWGTGTNSSEYLYDRDMIDFINCLETSLEKIKDVTRTVKTEQIAISKHNKSHKIWSYKNGTLQIEWGNLIRKTSLDDVENAFKSFSKLRKELILQQEKEEEEFREKFQVVKKFFIAGMVSLFFAVASTAIFIVFLFFIIELAIYAFIVMALTWIAFALFYYFQQKNVKGLIEHSGEQMGETVLPMLSSIPNNRKIVEMLTIFFIVFVFMAIYFSKTIPTILDKLGDPGHGIGF